MLQTVGKNMVESVAMAPLVAPNRKHWTIRDDETDLSHRRLLGIGGFGEVHELRRFSWVAFANIQNSCIMNPVERYIPFVIDLSSLGCESRLNHARRGLREK